MADTDDFYAVLGVDSDASAEEIRRAYRERAKETHPDQSDAPDASERFQRVKRAEEVLTDPAERQRYDRLGHERYVAGPGGPAGGDPTGDTGNADAAGATGTADTGSTGTGSGRRAGSGRAGGGRASHGGVGGAGVGGSRHGGSRRHRGDGVGRASHGGRQTTGAADPAGAGGESADPRGGNGSLGSQLGRGLRFFDRQQLRVGTSEAVFGFAAFFLYPIFLASSVLPTFPLPVNLLLGLCLLCTVGYLLATPEVGVIVFGAWTLFGPVVFLFTDRPLLSWPAFFLVATTAIPFALSLVVREVLRAPTR